MVLPDYSVTIDIDNTNVTVTMVGPDNVWLGLGFNVNSMDFRWRCYHL